MTDNNEYQSRVALYLRVSTDDQAEKFGIDLQRDALLGLIKSKGKLKNGSDTMKLAGEQYIYIDEGISGTTEMDERPAFARLKEDIIYSKENRPFDYVIVYKLDRFARRLKVLLNIVDFLEEYGIGFISATESIDTSTPFGRAMIGIIGVIAELELENIRARTQGGREAAKKQGTVEGAAAFGYTKDSDKRYVVLEEEAVVVRLIYDKFLIEKLTIQQIANFLTENGHQSPEASAITFHKKKGEIKKKNGIYFWRAEKVGQILCDEVYIGNYYYNKNDKNKKLPKDKWILSEHKHEAIIDPVTFNRSIELLKRYKFVKPKQNSLSHVYTLSGLLRCDSCKDEDGMVNWIGSRKEVEKGNQRFTYSYQCGRKNTAKNSVVCNTLPLPAEEIENYILNFVRKLLKNPKIVYDYQNKLKSVSSEIALIERERKHLQSILTALPQRKKNILAQHELGHVSTEELKERMEQLRVEEIQLRKSLSDLEYRQSQNSLSRGYIKTFELFEKKYQEALENTFTNRSEISALLRILIDSIVVYSRPVTEKDKIAGRKKSEQKIPYKIDVKFRLPQEVLLELINDRMGGTGWQTGYRDIDDEENDDDTSKGGGGGNSNGPENNQGFVVKSSELRPGWELNPPERFCRPLYNRFTTGSIW